MGFAVLQLKVARLLPDQNVDKKNLLLDRAYKNNLLPVKVTFKK